MDSNKLPDDPQTWSTEEVCQWLQEGGFSEYKKVFASNNVSGSVLLKLDRGSLAELIPSLGHRLLVLDKIEKIRGPKVPRHFGEGVVGGVNGFASKFMHGLSHLVNDPIEGASMEGVNGLVKGLATGLAGAIQYPVEGVVVFSKQLGDGFRYTPDAIFGAEPSPAEAQEQPANSSADSRAVDGPVLPVSSLSGTAEVYRSQELHPAHIGEGLVLGAQRFGSEFFSGMAGLVKEPMRAASLSAHEPRPEQRRAIAKGLAKGVTGAVCKPVAGTFDFASCTVEGLMATPQALLHFAREGPSLQDTPTFKRIAGLRLPAPDLARRFGLPDASTAAQVQEIRSVSGQPTQ